MYNNNTKILDITRNAQAIHSDAFQKIGAVQEARHNRYCLFVPVSSPFTSGQTSVSYTHLTLPTNREV